MTISRSYFVVSCARSGSTSLARILDTAINGHCLIEPVPNLNVESRDLMDGRLSDPRKTIADQILPRIGEMLRQGLIYGEKNVTLAPFIPYLYEMLQCKFVFLIRDGRDVATSLMNWHNEAFGSIYRECKEASSLSDIAIAALSNLPLELDTSDFARPRPIPSDPFYEEWPNLTRFEMVTWYWAYINRLIVCNLEAIPREDWITVNYTGVQAENIESLFNFLGLEGFDEPRISDMLHSKINSVEERFKIPARFPAWRMWDVELTRRFDRIAGETMNLLGYYK